MSDMCLFELPFYLDLPFKSVIFLQLRCFEALDLIKFFLSQWDLSGNLTTPKIDNKIIVNWEICNNVILNQSEKLQQH